MFSIPRSARQIAISGSVRKVAVAAAAVVVVAVTPRTAHAEDQEANIGKSACGDSYVAALMDGISNACGLEWGKTNVPTAIDICQGPADETSIRANGTKVNPGAPLTAAFCTDCKASTTPHDCELTKAKLGVKISFEMNWAGKQVIATISVQLQASAIPNAITKHRVDARDDLGTKRQFNPEPSKILIYRNSYTFKHKQNIFIEAGVDIPIAPVKGGAGLPSIQLKGKIEIDCEQERKVPYGAWATNPGGPWCGSNAQQKTS